jgi:hypothetical protein
MCAQYLVQACTLGVVSGGAFQMPFYSGSFLALALLSRFLVKLATAKFSEDAGLLAGTLETTQGCVKIFIFF